MSDKSNTSKKWASPAKGLAKTTSRFHISLKTFAAMALVSIICLAGGFVIGTNMAYNVAYNQGAKEAYNAALKDVAGLLQQKGITLDWQTKDDGSYVLTVTAPGGGQIAQVIVRADLVVEQRRNGQLVSSGRGQGTFTDLGKNWTVQQLGNLTGAVLAGTYINKTTAAMYLGNANNLTVMSGTAYYQLPGEYNTTNGLGRTTNSTAALGPTWKSTGVFTVNNTFTVATASSTVGVWGLYYGPYSATDFSTCYSLIAYDATPGTKNTVVGDTLTESWTVTVS